MCVLALFSACRGQTDENRPIHLTTEKPDTLAQILAARQVRAIEVVSQGSASVRDTAEYLHPELWLVDIRGGSADSVSYYMIVNGTHDLSIDPVDRNFVPQLLGTDPPTLKLRLLGGDHLVSVWRQANGDWRAVTMILTK